MFHLWCIGVATLDLCFKRPRRWSLNTLFVSITRWQMNSQNKACIWIWDMFLFQKLWMAWLWIMEIFFSFRVVDSLYYSAWYFAVDGLSLFVLLEFYLLAWFALTCLFEVHLRYFIVLSDLIYQGWWGKSAMIRLFLLVLVFYNCHFMFACDGSGLINHHVGM